MTSLLQNANPEILELTPEKEKRLQSVIADLYYSDPKSYDIIEAIMNRITKIEKCLEDMEKR